MNTKSWTKQEVLNLLNKKEAEVPKEIAIDDDNEQICFLVSLPFEINFNQGHWKLFFKTEEDVWGKLENDESFFGTFGIFEKELKTLLENIRLQAGLTKDVISLEKEKRMYDYDKQKNCYIMQDGMQINIGIRCKTAQIATNIICNLMTLYNMKI